MTDKHLFIGQNESTRADKIKNLINSFSIENKEVISYDLEEVDFNTLYEDLISPPFLTKKKNNYNLQNR
jgi:N-dimethylarginine dimethylaminohydrolase